MSSRSLLVGLLAVLAAALVISTIVSTVEIKERENQKTVLIDLLAKLQNKPAGVEPFVIGANDPDTKRICRNMIEFSGIQKPSDAKREDNLSGQATPTLRSSIYRYREGNQFE